LHLGQFAFLLFLASALACIAGWSAIHPALWWGLFVFAALNTLIGCVDSSVNERGRSTTKTPE
jgi:1,4-dihydroxy-2-naphthoate octaprenyltransferase